MCQKTPRYSKCKGFTWVLRRSNLERRELKVHMEGEQPKLFFVMRSVTTCLGEGHSSSQLQVTENNGAEAQPRNLSLVTWLSWALSFNELHISLLHLRCTFEEPVHHVHLQGFTLTLRLTKLFRGTTSKAASATAKRGQRIRSERI